MSASLSHSSSTHFIASVSSTASQVSAIHNHVHEENTYHFAHRSQCALVPAKDIVHTLGDARVEASHCICVLIWAALAKAHKRLRGLRGPCFFTDNCHATWASLMCTNMLPLPRPASAVHATHNIPDPRMGQPRRQRRLPTAPIGRALKMACIIVHKDFNFICRREVSLARRFHTHKGRAMQDETCVGRRKQPAIHPPSAGQVLIAGVALLVRLAAEATRILPRRRDILLRPVHIQLRSKHIFWSQPLTRCATHSRPRKRVWQAMQQESSQQRHHALGDSV